MAKKSLKPNRLSELGTEMIQKDVPLKPTSNILGLPLSTMKKQAKTSTTAVPFYSDLNQNLDRKESGAPAPFFFD